MLIQPGGDCVKCAPIGYFIYDLCNSNLNPLDLISLAEVFLTKENGSGPDQAASRRSASAPNAEAR